MDKVRVGIVGAGNIAQLNVLGYLEHPACEVVAVCDPDVAKARSKAETWGVPRVHARLEDLLADDLDAVEILTPTHLHREHVLAAVAAGRHVSVQKPVANTVADAREMAAAAKEAGVVLRITDNALHHRPMIRARELIRAGAIGMPTTIRIKTVVGRTDSAFQQSLDPQGYVWRFDQNSPGGHLFDDMVHKYALALWLVDEPVRSVQSVVRQGPAFFETPMVALFEYGRPDLLGSMEVAYAPQQFIRSRYYGADEFVEIQGTDGFIWVTRHTGEMLDLPPLMLYDSSGTTTCPGGLDADWGTAFADAGRHFVDALLGGASAPDMTPELAIETLQLCFAVYQASHERRPVEPASIDTSYSPPWWPLFRSGA